MDRDREVRAPGFSAGADGTEIQPAPLKEKAVPRNPGAIPAVTVCIVPSCPPMGSCATVLPAGSSMCQTATGLRAGGNGRRGRGRRGGGGAGAGGAATCSAKPRSTPRPVSRPGHAPGVSESGTAMFDDEPPAAVHRHDPRGAGPRQPQAPARPVAEPVQLQRRARQERRRRRAQAPPAPGELDALGRAGRGEEPADDPRPAAVRDDRDPSAAGARHGDAGLVGAGTPATRGPAASDARPGRPGRRRRREAEPSRTIIPPAAPAAGLSRTCGAAVDAARGDRASGP